MATSYILAVTGASGCVYAVRLAEELLKRGNDIDLIVSPSALLVFGHELGAKVEGESLKKTEENFKGLLNKDSLKGSLTLHEYTDIASKLSSGSALKKNMLIVPCSMGTLGRIASGLSGNLIERAADCAIKENGNLTLVPRETPLSAIHLENMLKLSRLGVKIIPAMPGFYNKPESIEDMVNFVIGKVLDSLGIENDLFKRWDPSEGKG